MSEKRKHKQEKINCNRQKQRESVNVSTQRLTMKKMLEIFAFEGATPLTNDLVDELIRTGWKSTFFDELHDILPPCECCGGYIVFYNKRRNSILSPSAIDDSAVFEFLKNGTVHLHTLPPEFDGAFTNLYSHSSATVH